jgi:hypothetical protein
MEALSMLDASDNDMFGYEDMSGITAWAALLKANTSITELNLAKNDINADDAKILAPAIRDNGALSVLSLKDNRLATKEGGKALAQALASNSTLKELDVSSNNWQSFGRWEGDGSGFAQELAVGIKDNGAILQCTFSGDGEGNEPVTMETSMVEADFSGKGLGISGAIMVAAFLPKCT